MDGNIIDNNVVDLISFVTTKPTIVAIHPIKSNGNIQNDENSKIWRPVSPTNEIIISDNFFNRNDFPDPHWAYTPTVIGGVRVGSDNMSAKADE